MYKGSGRSPVGYDIFTLLSNLSEHFSSFGGHKQACGLSFYEKDLKKVLELISEYSKDIEVREVKHLYLDLDIKQLSIDLVETFLNLEPFGVDFIKPLIKIETDINKKPIVLKDKYLKWPINREIDLLSFDANMDIAYYKEKTNIKAFVNMSINEFLNNKKINLIVDKFID